MKLKYLAMIVASLLVITGCATHIKPTPPHPPMPPMPPMPKQAALSVARTTPPQTVQVTMAWDASPDTNIVTGYYMYQGTNSRSYYTNYETGNVLTFSCSNLVRGVTYYFTVTAHTATGEESAYSNEVSYMVPLVPGPPGNLRFVALKPLSSTSPKGPWISKGAPIVVSASGDTAFYRLQQNGAKVSALAAASPSGPWKQVGEQQYTADSNNYLKLDLTVQ